MSASPPPRPDLPVMRHPRDGGSLARSASGQAAGIELWEPVPSPEAPGFRTLWQAISRRKRIITLVFAGTVLAIGAWTLTTRPVYTANVDAPDREGGAARPQVRGCVKSADPMPDYYQTQQQLLQSRSLANRVIALLISTSTRTSRTRPGRRLRSTASAPWDGSSWRTGCLRPRPHRPRRWTTSPWSRR